MLSSSPRALSALLLCEIAWRGAALSRRSSGQTESCYVRFLVTKLRGPRPASEKGNSFEIAEVEFAVMSDTGLESIEPYEAYTAGPKPSRGNHADRLIDGLISTSRSDYNTIPLSLPVDFRFPDCNDLPDRFRFTTTSGAEYRDPVQWKVEEYKNGKLTTVQEQTTDYTTPESRNAATDWILLVPTPTSRSSQWHVVLRYGNSSYIPTAEAQGDVVSHSGFAKLADSTINSISAGDGFSYYKLSTAMPGILTPVYVRTTAAYNDTARAMGWSANHDYVFCRRPVADDVSRCHWETPDHYSDKRFDIIKGTGNGCGRWFMDYGSTKAGCYDINRSTRCFSTGVSCVAYGRHAMIRDVVLSKYGTSANTTASFPPDQADS